MQSLPPWPLPDGVRSSRLAGINGLNVRPLEACFGPPGRYDTDPTPFRILNLVRDARGANADLMEAPQGLHDLLRANCLLPPQER